MPSSSSDWTRDFQPLAGLHLMQLGRSVAAHVTVWVLRSLGAEVTRVVPPTGQRSGLATTEGTSTEDLARAVLATGISTLEVPDDQAWSLLDPELVDMVVMDTEEGWPLADGIDSIDSYLERVSQTGIRAWVTIAPFGLSGPLATSPGGDVLTLAASGMLHYTRGSDDDLVVPAGFQAAAASGHVAALALVHALGMASDDETPVHVEVSAQEAVLTTSVLLETAHALYDLAGEPGTGRYGPPRGLLPCRDGHVFLSILEDHHWRRVKDALGDPDWARPLADLRAAREHGTLVEAELGSWTAERTRGTIVELLQEHGVPATGVNSCWELLADEDPRASSFWVDVAPLGRLPSVPFLHRATQNAKVDGPQTLRGLSGMRVADFSHVLAGPLATSWLGAMGAQVVRLEEEDRIDIYRRRGPHPAGTSSSTPDSLELSGYFAAANHTKRSVLEPTGGDPDLRAKLAQTADVVIENLSLHRREQLGLDFDAFRSAHEHATIISSSGFGRSGPRAGYRVYGTNLHCHAGIVFHTRDRKGHVCNIGTAAWADPITSIWIALAAASARITGMTGLDFDVSMAEVAVRHLFDQVAVASRTPPPSSSTGGSPIPTHRAPFATLASSDGEVMVVVGSEHECQHLADWLGLEDKVIDHDTWLDQAWELLILARNQSSSYPGTQLAADLRRSGVRAHRVMDARALAADPHLNARGLFSAQPHPAWGTQHVIGLPWRRAGQGPLPVAPTPVLGADSRTWEAAWGWS